ncbi:hypothetical protein [Cyanobium gracile]|uniref:Uncharacterized protein n=1 Tax=Cyanobium gracile (strain ATCC 27147 / PCC 6307) TaxID=292564 RepID=K9P814_CYAGP|nr:hypothetical protein [Cyanobium gracile]AFY29113.1 hypothetical protein Cyagr_1986 [Cyanobium gracile PCC 6307]
MSIPISASLDPEEQQLLADFEAGDLRSVRTHALLGQLQQAVKATDLKDHLIDSGDSSDDFLAI